MTRKQTPDVFGAVLGPVEVELSPLTTWEGGRLTYLEGVIEAGLQTFYDVGEALMEIRDGRLYRQTHRSFEAYTKERWGMGKSRAHQLMEAARTVAAISGPVEEGDPSTIVEVLPTNEAQVRALSGLDDQAKREVWAEAVATAPAGKVTGRHVAETARRTRGDTVSEVTQRWQDANSWTLNELVGHVQDFAAEFWSEPHEFATVHLNLSAMAGKLITQGERAQLWGGLRERLEGRPWQVNGMITALRRVEGEYRRATQATDGRAIVDIQIGPKVSTIVDALPGRDGRIERAQRLIDQCRAVTGRAFEDEYTALVGTPSDLLAVGRELDKIVAKLEHLQGTLQGEPEVDTWGEL